jgi:glycosyltransferase involved in cell wall biosynthesis
VNGVVTTLVELVREMELLGHRVTVIHPGLFDTRPCPGYDGIDLAVKPAKKLTEHMQALQPEAIHIATEGPLGWAARRYCLKNKLLFTTAFHTRFPEILKAALHVPLWLGYALFRHFHRPSSGVLVPTPSVLDMKLFQHNEVPAVYGPLGAMARPVSLFVGRLSYEKNIEAFLKLDVPGTKVVCGVGPLEASLKERHPHVRWLGVLPREELARVYGAADVFVMPSQSETFGLVMLEAMASGTPVAAFPVEGPLEVMGAPAKGGVLNTSLAAAWYGALAVPRHEARSRALDFGWAHAAQVFLGHLAPMGVTQMSSKT